DAVGVAVAAGDQVAGDDDHVGLELVDPGEVLNEVALPDDGAEVEVGNLHDLQTVMGRVESLHGHPAAVDLDPAAVDGQRVEAGQADARHGGPDGLAPAVLPAP